MKKLYFILFAILISFSLSGQTVKEISRDWVSFSQKIEVKTDSIKKFKVIASVKVEGIDEKSRAGIWARVDNKPEQGRGFFDNMGNRPITANKWESYTIVGRIDSKSEEINFGAICYNNGKFYFDKFELYIEDDNGEYQPVKLDNASFENKVVNSAIPNWSNGIGRAEPTRIREFTFNASEDAIDGAYAIVIEGSGIDNNTGTIKPFYPNIGIYIAILFLLIFVLTLITNISSTEEDKWSKLGSFGFRFSFIYFGLIIFFQNNGAYPFFDFLAKKPLELMQKFAPWFGEHVLGIPFKIATGPNGSGDTTFDYLVVLIIFITAVLGALIWSVIDRKRTSYKKLYYWLTTAMRYYVGLMLISYGLVKVIQLQFPEPSFYRLLQPYGESSPMGLAWTFLGFSEGYNMFMGIAEVLAGLLLFRRTQTLGAIITLMTAMNVMAVNYFFDVPVKILSTHLVLMTLFLLSRDIKKVMQFLLTNNPVERLTVIKRPKLKKWLDVSLKVLKGLVIAYALGYGFYNVLDMNKQYNPDVPKPELYGVYKVKNYVINNDTITNYKNDRLWKTIMFERTGSVQIETMNEKRISYKVEIDSITKKMKFSKSGDQSDAFDFNYTKTGANLDFNFITENDTISGKTKRMNDDALLLINRGFNWISERPYNR
ncbi:hypothetical protein [uncultured Lacinutrix sp.]|uniref:hypothetical protein n=1 Tax=uncultured Lacinutrix sp. TaxID=574032 RepID=UPI00261AD3C5|nr:hypothetical protein [uncultured Lacinutrix sp.]